jgi:uncharacterized protein
LQSGKEPFDTLQIFFEVFITGSNSTMLSSELSTYLAGCYIEVKVYPLSYRKYLAFCRDSNFDEFSRLGGLPGVVTLPNEVARDIFARFAIRNPALLSDVLKFLSANIGYPTSTKSIAVYLKKERISHLSRLFATTCYILNRQI